MLELTGDIVSNGQWAATVCGDRNVGFAVMADTKITFADALRLGTPELFRMLDFECDDGTNLTDACMPFLLMKKCAIMQGAGRSPSLCLIQETSPGYMKSLTPWREARETQFLICSYLLLKGLIDADTTSN